MVNTNNKIFDRITEYAVEFGIDKIILFGSRASDQDRADSDYDIAVIGERYLDFYLSLLYDEDFLETFDIHNYSEASETFKSEINKGVVIYEKT